MKCYICNHNMQEKIISINTGWGDYKTTINDVNVYVCPECGEKVIDSKVAIMIQKLSKNKKGE